MFYSEADEEFVKLVYEFFYKFSRFEYSLKANGFCKADRRNSKASADWQSFRERYENDYTLSDEATELLRDPPQMQVDINDALAFVDEKPKQGGTSMGNVIQSIQRIRNNLFHGGKHGGGKDNDISRNKYLLRVGCRILDQLSTLDDSVEFDYPGSY